MYILKLCIDYKRSEVFDVKERSGMHDNHSQDEVVFRGGKKTGNDVRKIDLSKLDIRIHKNRLRLRKWLIIVLIFLLTSLLLINTYSINQFRIVGFGVFNNDTERENYVEVKHFFKPVTNTGFLVNNKGCRIPAMQPYDPTVKNFVHKEDPLVCDHGTHKPLIDSNNTAVFVDHEAFDHFYNKSEEIDCCWRSFWRTEDQDNAVTYDNACYNFHNSAVVNAEFVKVECSRNKEKIYRDYFAFLPRKQPVEERCEKQKETYTKRDQHLSVLIVGLDSVSRLNFHRMMPKTVRALRKLQAVEMLGYTKVADNTYPNLVPVLSGLSHEELEELCWQDKKKTFDDCPFLWKNFSAAGYRTIFGEDACEMTTFNYLKPGFRVQPTDYYLRPFCIASEHDIGNTCKLNANLCVGTRKTFDNLLHYTRKVASHFAKKPYFGMFWQASLTHDFFNYPQLGDESYSDFLYYLAEEKLLNHTALIVMSDHGMRWGDFRQTYQGRMEDSLPFIFIVLPTWWREKYEIAWANLRRNTRRLTTAFDFHETLLDILDTSVLQETTLKRRTMALSNEESPPRGISWFLPVPDHRTCSMANISSHWCMCHSSSNISLDDPDLQKSAAFLVTELNRLLQNHVQCAILTLKTIKDAKVWSDKSDGSSLIDYTITIETEPGDAVFEGSVRYRNEDKSRTLVGSVSRLNAYGDQSACVDEFNLRLYCYCI